jgi:outer membrane translocation and assembly module TamA
LGIVLFQDIGFLYRVNQKFRFIDNLLTGTGFGLRYNTVVGPLRFDIGWRPKRCKEDCSFAWSLTLGQAF